jgi:hypothetical protein
MQRTLTLCDICGSQDDVVHCVVTIARRRSTYDLCGEHRAPLEELAKRVRPRRGAVLASTPFVEDLDGLPSLRAQRVGSK